MPKKNPLTNTAEEADEELQQEDMDTETKTKGGTKQSKDNVLKSVKLLYTAPNRVQSPPTEKNLLNKDEVKKNTIKNTQL